MQSNTIDELMGKLNPSEDELNSIIYYLRKQRGLHDAGVKPKKLGDEDKKGDLSHVLGKLSPKSVEALTKPKPMGRRV